MRRSSGGITFDEYVKSLVDFFPSWARKRMELRIPLNAFVLISVGELNPNKNNCVIISAMEQIKSKDIHYVLCGIGNQEDNLRKQADAAGFHNNVHFLGYRNDVKELYDMADCFAFPSKREGLSRSLMEVMACGLSCVVSRIGCVGYLCGVNNEKPFAEELK